jgi:outer membrane protein assembly factor BamB
MADKSTKDKDKSTKEPGYSNYYPRSPIEAMKVAESGTVSTNNGPQQVAPGDYVVRNVDGSLYVLDEQTFEEFWEAE